MKATLSGRDTRTFMKLVVEAKTQKVVGAHMIGPDAGEIIQGIAIAVKAGLTKEQFDATVAVVRDEGVPLMSLMFRGTLSEWTAGEEVSVMQVLTRNDATDLKGRSTRREYGLAFYRGKLPTTTEP